MVIRVARPCMCCANCATAHIHIATILLLLAYVQCVTLAMYTYPSHSWIAGLAAPWAHANFRPTGTLGKYQCQTESRPAAVNFKVPNQTRQYRLRMDHVIM